jgi:hypothetical protein
MKVKRITDEQITGISKEADAGAICARFAYHRCLLLILSPDNAASALARDRSSTDTPIVYAHGGVRQRLPSRQGRAPLARYQD